MYTPSDLDLTKLRVRAIKARAAIGRGTKYKLGQGGYHPFDSLPTRNGQCDCSGFCSWVLGLDRWQGRHLKRHSKHIPWIETSAVYRDAKGPNHLFVQLDRPVPGAIVVYPDRFGRQGHKGVVDNVGPNGFEVIHCSVGNDRKGDAIQRTSGDLFVRARAIFVALRQDVRGGNQN